jgi:hypothetical protein
MDGGPDARTTVARASCPPPLIHHKPLRQIIRNPVALACFAPDHESPDSPPITDEFLVCPTVFFAAKMRKIRNKPDGIHFLWFLYLFAANRMYSISGTAQ